MESIKQLVFTQKELVGQWHHGLSETESLQPKTSLLSAIMGIGFAKRGQATGLLFSSEQMTNWELA